MTFMFHNCSSLKSLDLSSLNISNTNDIIGMFLGCSSIKIENIKIKKDDKIYYYIKSEFV